MKKSGNGALFCTALQNSPFGRPAVTLYGIHSASVGYFRKFPLRNADFFVLTLVKFGHKITQGIPHEGVTPMKKAIVLVALILQFCGLGFSTSDPESLKGIVAIEVVIEKISEDAFGLTQEKLQTDVELRLRKAGIKVGRPALHEWKDFKGNLEAYNAALNQTFETTAMLDVRVSVMKSGEPDFTPNCIRLPVHLFVINVDILQRVKLMREMTLPPQSPSSVAPWLDDRPINTVFISHTNNVFATSTWSTGSFGFANSERSIRESVADHVDKFINDYLSMNPKQ